MDEHQRKKAREKTSTEIQDEKSKNQNDIVPADEIVYKDSSTFLKVRTYLKSSSY